MKWMMEVDHDLRFYYGQGSNLSILWFDNFVKKKKPSTNI